ncbi:MAG: twin-arginine translocase TatA/TatE family subunit [Planctomycetes bacterium]|nr:twin-arginine translocase TatA/TatE family subunit [Planctomycetota bacterium]
MLAFGIPNGWEWIIILLVILLLFGHRLPGMARALGSGITEFKRGITEGAEKSDGQQ